jgi:hypothetical protein
MPFFIPIDYHDDRNQFVDNITFFSGAHTFKAGVEYNRTAANQIFRGFINGRYIFASTDAFFDYLQHPDHQEDVLLFIQQAGVGDTTAEEAGTQTIVQEEWGVFVQDTWQPIPGLTINWDCAGKSSSSLPSSPRSPSSSTHRSSARPKTGRSSRATGRSRRTRTCGSRASVSPGIR